MGPLPPRLRANALPPCPGIFLRDRTLFIRGWDAPLATDGHVVDVSDGSIHVFVRPMNPDDLLLLVTREMPFGKHKGAKMEDVPLDYLKWALREMINLDANLRHAMQKLVRGESLDEEAPVSDPA